MTAITLPGLTVLHTRQGGFPGTRQNDSFHVISEAHLAWVEADFESVNNPSDEDDKMAVTFFDPGASNFFGYKHLYVVSTAMSVDALMDEGQRVLDERRTAANQRKRGGGALSRLYGGSTKPTENTLIVMTQGGLVALELAATQAATGLAVGRTRLFWFNISNAAVIHDDLNNGTAAASTGEVQLRAGVNATGIYVDHFEGMRNMRWIDVGDTGMKQLKTMAFRTTSSELQQAITRLRHVPPPGAKLPPAIVYGVPGLDLGFLDD